MPNTNTITIQTANHELVYTYTETPHPRLPSLLAHARYTGSVNGRTVDTFEGARALNHWRAVELAADRHEREGSAIVTRT
jgi:hypothetical protein